MLLLLDAINFILHCPFIYWVAQFLLCLVFCCIKEVKYDRHMCEWMLNIFSHFSGKRNVYPPKYFFAHCSVINEGKQMQQMRSRREVGSTAREFIILSCTRVCKDDVRKRASCIKKKNFGCFCYEIQFRNFLNENDQQQPNHVGDKNKQII